VGVNLSVSERCRMAVVGRNGSGKSTLLGLVAGSLLPEHGEAVRHRSLRVACLGQHDAERLCVAATPLDFMQESFPGAREHELLEALEAFGVGRGEASQPMESLSGGQRMRVAFARMSRQLPHLLVLDEPTNNLDIYAIEALTDALKSFEGGVIFVTHNRTLLEELAQEVAVVGDRGVRVESMAHEVLAVGSTAIRADNRTLLE